MLLPIVVFSLVHSPCSPWLSLPAAELREHQVFSLTWTLRDAYCGGGQETEMRLAIHFDPPLHPQLQACWWRQAEKSALSQTQTPGADVPRKLIAQV